MAAGLDEAWAAVPARALSYQSIKLIGYYLNPDMPAGCNWKDLGDLMQYPYQFLRNLEMKASPTEELLSLWTAKPDSTMGSLVQLLKDIGRDDAVEEALPLIAKDVDGYKKRTAEGQRAPTEAGQSPGTPGLANAITTSDVMNNAVTYYDAFVSYAPDDFWFVQLLMTKLEQEHNFRLCIADRDILAGGAMHSATAKLIDERCKRVIIVISKNYNSSDECDWQLKFAHSLAPGAHKYNRLLPVLIENDVRRPSILLPYVASDYTKMQTREWFWDRLIFALRAEIGSNSHYIGADNGLPYPMRAPRGDAPPSYHSNGSSSTENGGDTGACSSASSTTTCSSVFVDHQPSSRVGPSVSSPSLSASTAAESTHAHRGASTASASSLSGSLGNLATHSPSAVRKPSFLDKLFKRKDR